MNASVFNLRNGVILTALGALLLLWPYALNGGMLAFADSPGYVKGGEMALAKLRRVLESLLGHEAEIAGAGSGATTVYGVRSAYYSLFVRLGYLPGQGFLGVALLQAALVAGLALRLAWLIDHGLSSAAAAALLGFLAIATAAPFFASYLTPDVFAAILVLCALLLTLYDEQLRAWERAALVALAAFSCTAHLSHLPLGVALALLAPLVAWLAGARILRATILVAIAPLLAALGNIAVGVAAFDEVSVAPKRYPLLLARSIEDGPARWYLDDRCPQADYAVCELFTTFPDNARDFLWGPSGIRQGTNPAQIAQIRAEEAAIVRNATRAYPWHQIRASLSNWAAQIIKIDLYQFSWHRMEVPASGPPVIDTSRHVNRDGIERMANLHRVVLALGIVVLLVSVIRNGGLTYQDWALLAFVVGALLANAAVCGILSAPAGRYQARIAWLLPTVCVLLAWRLTRARQALSAPARETVT